MLSMRVTTMMKGQQRREANVSDPTTMSHLTNVSKKCPSCKAWLVMNKCNKCGFALSAPTPSSSTVVASAAALSSAAADEPKPGAKNTLIKKKKKKKKK
jgi:hypothetical protein